MKFVEINETKWFLPGNFVRLIYYQFSCLQQVPTAHICLRFLLWIFCRRLVLVRGLNALVGKPLPYNAPFSAHVEEGSARIPWLTRKSSTYSAPRLNATNRRRLRGLSNIVSPLRSDFEGDDVVVVYAYAFQNAWNSIIKLKLTVCSRPLPIYFWVKHLQLVFPIRKAGNLPFQNVG